MSSAMGPANWVEMQPAFRHGAECYCARIQISWVPGADCVVSLTITEGENEELRSLVVGQPVELFDALTHAQRALLDLSGLIRRSSNPFDDLT